MKKKNVVIDRDEVKREAEKAVVLLASIKMELEKGTLHYDQSGKLLKTTEEILDALNRGEKVSVVQGAK